MVKLLATIFIALLILSCSNDDDLKHDLVGQWQSKSGAILLLKSDSTFTLSNLPVEATETGSGDTLLYPKGTKLTYDGYWEIEKYTSTTSFHLHSVINKDGKVKYKSIEFIIIGGGFLQLSNPDRLQIWHDSDGLDFDEFRRTSNP